MRQETSRLAEGLSSNLAVNIDEIGGNEPQRQTSGITAATDRETEDDEAQKRRLRRRRRRTPSSSSSSLSNDSGRPAKRLRDDRSKQVPALPEYSGKHWADYYEYTNRVELNCNYKPFIAPTEKNKVLYVVIPCTKNIQDSWRLRQISDTRLRTSPTWADFKEFLAGLLEHPVNRGLSAADRYETGTQRAGQTTDEFATYMSRLEEELLPYGDLHRK